MVSDAEGAVLEIGDTDITKEGLCSDLEEIKEDIFDLIEGLPDERWVGGVGCSLGEEEVGLIGGIALCDAIKQGAAQLERVANFDLGANYDYIQN